MVYYTILLENTISDIFITELLNLYDTSAFDEGFLPGLEDGLVTCEVMFILNPSSREVNVCL